MQAKIIRDFPISGNIVLFFFGIFGFSLFFLLSFYIFSVLFGSDAIFYFLAVFVLAVLGSFLFLFALKAPYLCLVAALILNYNPYYVYLIFTNLLSYGIVRVAISSFFILLLSFGIFLKFFFHGKIKRAKTPLDLPLLIFLIFPLFATAVGFWQGNSIRLIGDKLFPIIEFIAYFFLATIILQNKKQAIFVLKSILAWLIFIGAGAVLFYLFAFELLAARSLPAGITLYRLYDFMSAIALPLLIGLYFYPSSAKIKTLNKKRLFILSLSFVPLFSLTLSFFRSLWMGIVGALIFVFLMCWRKKGHFKAILLALVLFSILFFSVDFFFFSRTQMFGGVSLSQIFYERAFHSLERTIYTDAVYYRLEQIPFLLNIIYQSPLTGIGFGSELTDSISNYYLGVAAMMGLPALFFLFWLMFILMKSGLKIFRQVEGVDKGWVLGILASFVSVALLIASFPAVLHFPIPAYLGFLGACLFIFQPKNYGPIHKRN